MKALLALALAGCLSTPPKPTRSNASVAERGDAREPGPMISPRLSYDVDAEQIIMFSGSTAGVLSNQLWALSGNGWVTICSAPNGPSPRALPAFGYDSARHSIVVAGGSDATQTVLDDTYECTRGAGADTWAIGPKLDFPSAGANLVDDGTTVEIVGGFSPTSGGAVGSVYLYLPDQGIWGDAPDVSEPVAGYGMLASIDPDHHRILAFADGSLGSVGGRDDMFFHTLGTKFWETLCRGCTGRVRSDSTLVHVPGADEDFLIDGDAGKPELGGVWERDGDQFLQISTDPPERDSVGAAWDAARGVIVIYGGNGSCGGATTTDQDCGETWELTP